MMLEILKTTLNVEDIEMLMSHRLCFVIILELQESKMTYQAS